MFKKLLTYVKKTVLPITILILLLTGEFAASCFAAVGCSLRDPDRDVRRLFPESTGYKTRFITIKERGGSRLLKRIEEKLGDHFEPVYETIDVPYAFYTILQDKQVIGYIHGVNQKGEFGGLQLILATDPTGKIVSFYYQRISSPESKKLRDSKFTDQFKGLTLADFYLYDPADGILSDPATPLAGIKNPCQRNDIDFKATLRGLKKNLIIFDEFIGENRYDKAYEEIKESSQTQVR